MIVRIFRGIVHEGRQQEFHAFFEKTALPIIREQEGLVSVTVGAPHESSPREFTMITVWSDLEALKGFSGEDWASPVIHPDEEHLLEEVRVHHYHALEA